MAVICITSLSLSAEFAENRADVEEQLISNFLLTEASRKEIFGLNDKIEALQPMAATQSAMRKLAGNTESALQELFVNRPEAIRIIDLAEQAASYVGPAFESIFARPRDEMYRDPQSWLKNVHPADEARVAAILGMNSHVPLPESFEIEYRVLRPNGSVRWVLDRGVFVRDGLGKIARLVGMASDVTEYKTFPSAE